MDLPHHQACRGLTEAPSAMAPELPRMGRKRTLRAGESLYRAGDPTETTFLVIRGRIRALAPGRLDSYGPGELVGELCFCAVRARQEAASATQATDVVAGPHTMWGLVGVVPLATAFAGTCPLYSLSD